MFPVIVYIAFSLVPVKAFKIDGVNPSTISQTNPTLLIQWTRADGDNLSDIPIRLLLVSSEQPLDPTQWVEGDPLIDGTTSPNFTVTFADIPAPGRFLLQAAREEDHWETLNIGIPPVSITVTNTPGPIISTTTIFDTSSPVSPALPSPMDSTLSSITASSTSESTPSSTTTASTGPVPSGGETNSTRSISTPAEFISVTSSTPTFATSPSNPTSPTAPAPSDNPQSRTKPMTGIIVGSTLGGIAAILFLGLGVLIYRRRQMKRRRLAYEELTIFPYPETQKTRPSVRRKILRREEANVVGQQSPAQLHPESRPQGEVPDRQGDRRVLYHDDSGWRSQSRRLHGGTSGSVLEMPPRYDAVL